MDISDESRRVLEAFDAAAQQWGWSSDQGSQEQADKDYAVYAKALLALEARIARLEGNDARS